MDNRPAVAIIGMACRFPGGRTVEEYWQNLRDGVESIRVFTDRELASAGVEEAMRRNPAYVPANGALDGIELFDAAFFGFTPREAEITDPQQRLFLEVCWEALESAGYVPETFPGLIGVFAGAGTSTYLLHHLLARPDVLRTVGDLELLMANTKDYVPTRVAYKLDLRGPAVNSNTACSTGLVNVHLACQSLLAFECDMALAGGVSVQVPQARGYLWEPGGILSPDGHCRAFDARAAGTVSGNGAGVVLLRRFDEALAARDRIRAVILGSAMNNDGADKAGFTAPSVSGQAAAIAQALALADVPVETIGYVEAHGTGTPVGDPIELAALARVFRAGTRRTGFCAIGSVKTNFGHLDEAAGVAGLMKAALALEHGEIPPSLHFETPNPECGLAESPFYVAARRRGWPADGGPRRAGVSSFGLGGTNVHAVLEEAPASSSGPSRPWQMLLLSARTATALEAASARLAEALERNRGTSFADAAYTLVTGRRRFAHRRVVVAGDRAEAIRQLRGTAPAEVVTAHDEAEDRPVVFMFSGHGAQYAGMSRGVHEAEPVFREELARCAGILGSRLGRDIREVVFAAGDGADGALRQMSWAQPAVFAVEYALARLWMSWGVRPAAMIGHSAGEYVAACLAGVLSLEEALVLIAERGRLLDRTPRGAMLAVTMKEEDLLPRLGGALSVSVVTTPEMCVVSGPADEVEAFRVRAEKDGVDCRRVDIEVGAHSALMEPVLDEFRACVARVALGPPRERFVSNVTGTWITPEEAIDPAYWARHLRSTVRFSQGVELLLREYPAACFLEIGPGRSLASPVLRHPARTRAQPVLTTLRHAEEQVEDEAFLLSTLGRLWAAGVRVDPGGFYTREERRRVPLPTYPFERKRYWIEPTVPGRAGADPEPPRARRREVDEWLYLPSWRRSLRPTPRADRALRRYLVIGDRDGLASRVAERLRRDGHDVAQVPAGWVPDERTLATAGEIVDFRACDDRGAGASDPATLLLDLLHLGQALGRRNEAAGLTVVSTGVQDVTGEERFEPVKAVILGPVQVIEQEYPHVRCRSVDVVFPARGGPDEAALVDRLAAETVSDDSDRLVAWRGAHRWCREFVPLRLPPGGVAGRLRPEGVYVITGGAGEVGGVIAEYLARTVRARLVLTSRSRAPRPELLHRLEAAGALVMLRNADVADEARMRAVLDEAVRRFGRIDGVVHAAGITSAETVFRAVSETTPAEIEAVFRPKVAGTIVLERLLRGLPLDFCLLISSNASTLGGLGLSAYSAASHFLDAFAGECRRRNLPWTSSNWDGWPSETASGAATHTRIEAYTMTRAEAEAAFARVIACDAERVVVSAGDLHVRLESWLRGARAVPSGPDGSSAPADEAHARPGHLGDFAEPRSEVERAVAETFEELVGVRPVGLHDNFFELGGDSLLGSRAVARLTRRFRIDLSVRALFADPTVARLAARVEEASSAVPAPVGPAAPDEEEGVL